MALMERKRNDREDRTRTQMRVYKRRRRGGLFVFGALVLLVLGGLTYAIVGSGAQDDRGAIGQVEPPQMVEAPNPVSEEPAEKAAAEERAAEQKAAEERKAREEAEAARKREEERKAAEESGPLAGVEPPSSEELYLTVPKMGLVGDYVANDASEGTLVNGAGKIPSTGFPWQEGANTYIASHVLGYQGTGSYMHFAALPSMTYGDEFYLTDASGNEYRYVVNEILTVPITDVWVTHPVPGRTMVSLQTCVNPPAYDLRLVVRGELVSVNKA